MCARASRHGTLAAMFTGIITDIGEVAAREGGRFTIRCGYAAESIAIGASIACDGACLTATRVEPSGNGSTFTVDVSNETLAKDDAGRVAAGPAHQPGARTQGRRRAGRAYRGGPCGRRRPDRCGCAPTASPAASRSTCRRIWPPTSPPRARSPSTASRSPSTRCTENRFGINIIPHTLTHTTLGAKKPGDRVNLEVDLFARYVARLMEFRPVNTNLPAGGLRRRQGLSLAHRRDHRGSAQRPHDHPGRRRGPRERGRPRDPGADGDARRHQLHGQARPRPHLPVADAPARRPASAGVHVAAERGEEAHGLHGVDRGARGRGHRHLRARPRPHHRHGHRPHQGLQRHRLAGPRVPADRPRGRRAGPRRAYGGERRSRAAGRASTPPASSARS